MPAQFTPGPWRWLDGNNLMGDHGHRPIILSAQKLYMRDEYNIMIPANPFMADARLIAAAPTMYAALEAIQQGFVNGSIKFTKRRQSDNDPHHPANVLMCVALDMVKDGQL